MKVLQCDIEGNVIRIFSSPREASRITGIRKHDIKRCLLKLRNYAGGFTWKFQEEKEPIAQVFLNIKTAPDKENILVIGDTHSPFEKEGYLEFCTDIKEKHKCTRIIHIGDEVDHCAVSNYQTPDGAFSSSKEFEKAKKQLHKWKEVFPIMDLLIGNHTKRPMKQANQAGIPLQMMRTYNEMWDIDKQWKWHDKLVIDETYFTHGTGMSGDRAAIRLATDLGMNVVIGHIHHTANVTYKTNAIGKSLFGMQVGCGVEESKYAFYYAKDCYKKGVISCATITDGVPQIHLM